MNTMKPSTISLTAKTKYCCAAGAVILIALAAAGLFVGKYPLSLDKLLSGDDMQWRVFLTLRLSRTVVGVIGGFALGVAGFVYQTVFRNPLEYDEHVEVTNADYDTMKAHLLHAARSLGLNTRRLEIEDMGHGFLQAKAKDLSINVHPNLTISILPHYKSEMPAGIPLPKKYNLSPKASYEDNQKTAAYLRKKYRKLINMKKSKVKIDNFDFRNNNVIWFYEADGNLTEQIINYNFNNIRFHGNENGNLGGIRIYQYDLSQKIGDYPVISLEEAKKLLVDGYYYGGNGCYRKRNYGRKLYEFLRNWYSATTVQLGKSFTDSTEKSCQGSTYGIYPRDPYRSYNLFF